MQGLHNICKTLSHLLESAKKKGRMLPATALLFLLAVVG